MWSRDMFPLNLQIEHHMAPQMPMENLRLIRQDCKDVAKRLNLPYRELSFVEALRVITGMIVMTVMTVIMIYQRRSFVEACCG